VFVQDPGLVPARPAAVRAASARPRPGSSAIAAAGRSSPNRNPTPAASGATGSRCRARTGSRTTPAAPRSAAALDARNGAARPATAARSVPTTRPRPARACAHFSSRLPFTPIQQPSTNPDTPSFPDSDQPHSDPSPKSVRLVVGVDGVHDAPADLG
jgi:hypothetical protein